MLISGLISNPVATEGLHARYVAVADDLVSGVEKPPTSWSFQTNSAEVFPHSTSDFGGLFGYFALYA
jgi:hypothetical protein